MQAAGGNAGEQFTLLADEPDDFSVALGRRMAGDGFPPQIAADLLEPQREMQKAVALRFQPWRDSRLTSTCAARLNHLRIRPRKQFFHLSEPKSRLAAPSFSKRHHQSGRRLILQCITPSDLEMVARYGVNETGVSIPSKNAFPPVTSANCERHPWPLRISSRFCKAGPAPEA